MSDLSGYWITRFVFEKALAVVYLIGFLTVIHQFIPLLGERGLLPVPIFVRRVPFRRSPSLFYWFPHDIAFRTGGWVGLALSAVAFSGIADSHLWSSIAVWLLLWMLYLSFVNVGQTFYAFGWESMLAEAGFFAAFSGTAHMMPQIAVIWIWRWLLFRVMFGAGMIKLRADPCWKELTCLNYHFETQPMPNPLSWYFHWLPHWAHSGGVLFNHLVELAVPFGYFLPQPIAGLAGLLTILFQVILMLSGNLSWLNLLTIVLAVPTLDGRLLGAVIPVHIPVLHPPAAAWQAALWILAGAVAWLSVRPVRNMLSSQQMMNYSYNPLHLVNTYGAFGSVTRLRHEVVIEGSSDAGIGPNTEWKEYEFWGKPVATWRRPPQVAPYHLRLDWLLWFAAMRPGDVPFWFYQLLSKLLRGDPLLLRFVRTNPFPGEPPRHVRALLYEYRFTTPGEKRASGQWWNRVLIGRYSGPVETSFETLSHPPD